MFRGTKCWGVGGKGLEINLFFVLVEASERASAKPTEEGQSRATCDIKCGISIGPPVMLHNLSSVEVCCCDDFLPSLRFCFSFFVIALVFVSLLLDVFFLCLQFSISKRLWPADCCCCFQLKLLLWTPFAPELWATFQSNFDRWVVKMITSNAFLFSLTLLGSCLLISALPSEHTKNVKIVSDDANRVAKDESDNSSGSRSDEFVLPVSRYGRINERKLMGRKNDAPSTCGYEVLAGSLYAHLSI